MSFEVSRLGHIGIHVTDVNRSIEFYRKVCGFKLTGNWGPPDFSRPDSEGWVAPSPFP